MKKGFTLIELLVVIIIIGTLAALLVANFMSARERARDVQRKQDLKQIQTALEMYKQDQNPPSFPEALPSVGSCWSSGANCTGNVYMKVFPGDPNRTSSDYYYKRDTLDVLKYTLCACLENKADISAVTGDCLDDNLPAGFPGGIDASYTCNSDKKIVITEE